MEQIINSIRNVLRSKGITGMNSFKHCVAFTIFRMLTKEKCNNLGINTKVSFDYVMDNYEDKQDLYDMFYYENNSRLNFIGELINKMNF